MNVTKSYGRVVRLSTQMGIAGRSWSVNSFIWMLLGTAISFAPPVARCQTFVNGSVVGVVTDQSGAVVPNVAMGLINEGTNTARTTQTSATGLYQFVDVPPGSYTVQAEKPAFRKYVHESITIQVNATVSINIILSVGSTSQQVTVVAGTPLLEPESSSIGQVITPRATENLPLNGRNPLALLALVPGAVLHQGGGTNAVGKNPFYGGNFQIGGGFAQESSTYWDGAPLNVGYAHNLVIMPTQDAIEEFKIQTNNLPAQFGRFSGGIVNFTTKTGTNGLHGSAYEFIRNKVLNANNFFDNRLAIARPAFTQNQFGATIAGPVTIPRIYNGKDKTFFFFSYGGFQLRQGIAYLLSVPTEAERQGNFSALSTPIYDSTTTHADPTNPANNIRNQYSCNGVLNVICPDQIDVASAQLANLWALPNIAGAAPNLDNWAGNASSGGGEDQETIRIDQNVGDKQRIFGRYTLDVYHTLKQDVFGTGAMTAATPGGGQPETFRNQQFVLDDSYTITSTMLADVNASVVRQNYQRTAVSLGYGLSNLSPGWGSISDQVTFRTLPSIAVTGITGFIANTGSVIRGDSTVYDIFPNVTKLSGSHNIKLGGEYMILQFNYIQEAGASGVFSFDNTYTALNPTSTTGGFGFASFLAGYATSGSLATSVPTAAQQIYPALYIEDTYKATRKLTLNLGLRWERMGPWSERFNRQSDFNVNLPSPLAGPTGLPLEGSFELVASPTRHSRNNINPDNTQFSPRVGFAYGILPNTVLHGGYAINWLPNDVTLGASPYEDPINNISNSYVASINGGLTPSSRFSDPFPNGLLQPPQRNANFQQSFYGQSLTVVRQPNASFSSDQQFNLDVQHQFPSSLLIDAAFVGSKGTHLTLTPALDQLPLADMSMGSALLKSVPNPFYGLIQSGPLSSATTTAGQLLLPFPQFTGLTWAAGNVGNSHYDSLQVKVQKNFAHGGILLASYTLAKNITNAESTGVIEDDAGQGSIQNSYNLKGEQSLASFDVPQDLVVSYALDLPFGAGKRYLRSATGVAEKIVSGWGVDGITTFQRGFPLHLGTSTNLTHSYGGGSRPNFNASACPQGAALDAAHNTRVGEWFNTACYVQPPAFTFGNVSRTLPNVRTDGINNWDFALFKTTPFGPDKRFAVQFRAEMFNLYNRPQFDVPGETLGTAQFGVVSAQLNNPRLVQFALRLSY